MTITQQRRECYWLLMQWRQRATNDLCQMSIRNLPKGMDRIEYLDRVLKQIHAGIRAMAVGVGGLV